MTGPRFAFPTHLGAEAAKRRGQRAAAAANGAPTAYRIEGVSLSMDRLAEIAGLSRAGMAKRYRKAVDAEGPVTFASLGITEEMLERNNVRRP